MEGRFSEELVIEYWAHGRFGDGTRTGFRNEVIEYLTATLKIKNHPIIYEVLDNAFAAGRIYAHEFAVKNNGEELRLFLIAISSLKAWEKASKAESDSFWETICEGLDTAERELVTRHCWLKEIKQSVESAKKMIDSNNASFNAFYSNIFGILECELEKLKAPAGEEVASDPEYGCVREKIRAKIENLVSK